MAAIDFGHFSNRGRDGQAGAASLVNAYTEIVETKEGKSTTPVYCCPGLARWDSGTHAGAIRGSIWVKNHGLFAVLGNELIQFISPSVEVNWGSIPGTGPVSMAANQRQTGPQIGIVTSTGAYFVADTALGAPVVDWSIPNLPAPPINTGLPYTDFPPPTSICYVSNYFVYTMSDGRIFHGGINDATTVNPLSFGMAQVSSNGLVRSVQHRGMLIAMGPKSYEVWQNAGTFPFAFSPIPGAINVGLLAFDSVAQTDDSLIFVDNEGKVMAVVASYPERISNHGVERAIEALTLAEKQALRGTYYFFEGNKIYSLSSDGNWTYEFNFATKLWHQRETYGRGSWIGRCATQVDDVVVIGNAVDGKLYTVDIGAYLDGTELAPLTAIGQLIHGFPSGIIIDRVLVDAVRGTAPVTGDAHADDPQLVLDFSKDGGRTWEGGFTSSLGAAGDYTRRIQFNRLGCFREPGVLLRFSCSAPVFRALMNCEVTMRKLGR